jgi:hypothetical protein
MVENNTINQPQTVLTEEAKQRLSELETELLKQEQSTRSENRDYIKFKDGDRKILWKAGRIDRAAIDRILEAGK